MWIAGYLQIWQQHKMKILPARSCYENVAASLELTGLVEDTSSTIGHHTLHHGALSKLARLIVDLDGQLPETLSTN